MNTYSHLFDYNQMNLIPNTQENQIALNKALVACIAETQDIVADSKNPFHKNQYASLSAHLSALKPIFAKHGLAVLQFPIGDSESVGVRTIILHKDGGSISSDALVPSEKGMSGQNAGALYSYVRRYSLASVAGCATEDCDAETDRIAKSSKEVVTLGTTKTSKYIPNPNAKAVPASSLVVPFGDAKGVPLSELPIKSEDRSKKCADLNYWANAWQPKPFGDNPNPSPKDLAIKAEAKRLWDIAQGVAPSEPQAQDEIPF